MKETAIIFYPASGLTKSGYLIGIKVYYINFLQGFNTTRFLCTVISIDEECEV